MRHLLTVVLLVCGCANRPAVIETYKPKTADTIVENNRDWVGIGIVAGTIITGYAIWEYYKWTKSSNSHENQQLK